MADKDLTTGRPIFLRALGSSTRRIPLWLLCWVVMLLLALVVALPWMDWFAETLGNRYAPGAVLASMDETFRFDHRTELAGLRRESGGVAALLALVAMLVGVFFAGGWLQVFLERTTGHSVRRFLWGGARYYWRFLRVWIGTFLTLAIGAWVLFEWPWNFLMELLFDAREGDLEVLASERSALWVGWIQAGAYALLVALTVAWGVYTRTRIALHDGRSALWAGACTWALILLHPVRTLRPFLLLLLLEIGVIVLIGSFSWGANTGLDAESTWTTVGLLFVLGQVALMWQTISRAARYSAAVQVSRQLVAPLAQPDPWASRVGGPGGPQYPIDDTDDYGVSI